MYLFPLWQKRRSGFVQNSYSNRKMPGLLPAIVRESTHTLFITNKILIRRGLPEACFDCTSS
ncbi:hypothetical protein CA14_012094 [Aspergillus flavus]|uniref:Uncharacterized protein n=1 Tax=Aspergillus flavus TaxID=5059 RepID=A0AB74BRW4_ASPFL|nr:hypothetical protein CA14_012094 [Aspergillus flavus]